MRKVGVLILIIMLVIPAAVRAQVSLSLGAVTWFAWWMPWWASISGARETIRPGLLGGASAALQLPRHVSITSVFMYGRPTIDQDAYMPLPSGLVYRMKKHRSFDRWDSDSSVGWSPKKYLRLYLGFKYSTLSYRHDLSQPFMIDIVRSRREDVAPALGMAFTIPLVKSLYLLFNVSASYLLTIERYTSRTYMFGIISPQYSVPMQSHGSERRNFLGGTAQLGLAYFIAPANVTLTLGGRYQCFWDFKEYFNMASRVILDQSWGITASVMYRIEIARRSENKPSQEGTEKR